MGHLRAFAATLAVFLACAEHASVDAAMMDDDIITVPRVVQYQLLSIYSGRFVGVTTDGCIHAMGDIRDPRTKFLPRMSANGKWAFESYCESGQYIVFDKMVAGNDTEIKFRLGVPRNNNELFEQISPFQGVFAYKASSIEPEHCYMGFDSFGNNCGELLCELNTSHMATLIRYIESVEETNCQHTQLKSSRMEL